MDELEDSLPKSTVYYDDLQCAGLPFLPLLVAHLDRRQDTVILGPQKITRRHDRFIQSLYASIGAIDEGDIAIRCITFGSRPCVLVCFPTAARDAGGRAGLVVAVGFLINEHLERLGPHSLAGYMRLVFDCLNQTFGTALPVSGSDKLHAAISGGSNSTEFAKALNQVSNLLLFYSAAFGDLIYKQSVNGWLSALTNGLRRIASGIGSVIGGRRQRIPRLVLYPQGAEVARVIDLVLGLIAVKPASRGATFVSSHPTAETTGSSHYVLLRPLGYPGKWFRHARCHKLNGVSCVELI